MTILAPVDTGISVAACSVLSSLVGIIFIFAVIALCTTTTCALRGVTVVIIVDEMNSWTEAIYT